MHNFCIIYVLRAVCVYVPVMLLHDFHCTCISLVRKPNLTLNSNWKMFTDVYRCPCLQLAGNVEQYQLIITIIMGVTDAVSPMRMMQSYQQDHLPSCQKANNHFIIYVTLKPDL